MRFSQKGARDTTEHFPGAWRKVILKQNCSCKVVWVCIGRGQKPPDLSSFIICFFIHSHSAYLSRACFVLLSVRHFPPRSLCYTWGNNSSRTAFNHVLCAFQNTLILLSPLVSWKEARLAFFFSLTGEETRACWGCAVHLGWSSTRTTHSLCDSGQVPWRLSFLICKKDLSNTTHKCS